MILPTVAVAAALVLAGCVGGEASQSPEPAAPGSSNGHEHDHGHQTGTETHERSPRIVVATDSGVSVLDDQLETLGEFETQARPTLVTAHTGRHVLAVQGDAGVVEVIDGGSWAVGHGDHFHYYVTDPAMFAESLTGGSPVHVVGNQRSAVTTVFFDDDGNAQVLTDEALEHAELDDLTTIETSGAHHGVVVPLADGDWLVTQPGDTGALPDMVELQDDAGTVAQTFTCNDMHGEVVVGNTAAFGCVDSILLIADGQETVLANPDDSGERVGALVANADASTIVGDWASDSLVFINGDDTSVTQVGTQYSNIVATPDDRFAVLGTDGVLRIFDAAGVETETYEITEAWEKPQGHGGLSPALATGDLAGATMIWVSDPHANKVHAVDLFSQAVTSVDVAGSPGSIAVANAADPS